MAVVSSNDFTNQPKTLIMNGDIDRIKDAGVFKAYIPEFLYKPPYGYPRKEDLLEIRKLAKTPYVHLIIRTLAQQVGTTPWEIKVKEEFADDENNYEQAIKDVMRFFNNPNGNFESFEDLLVAWTTDLLELDSGVGVKVFNAKGELTQVFARDGATFLKNPDKYGYIGDREDIIMPLDIDLSFAQPKKDNRYAINEGTINQDKKDKLERFYEQYMRERAAYFQYGWTAGAMPIPFGKREIIWFQSNYRADSIYGRSPVEVLGDVLFILLYGSSYSLDMFVNNNIPAGIITLLGANEPELAAFKSRFESRFISKDVFDNTRTMQWQAPVTNQEASFTPFNFNSKDMAVLEGQQWYLKLAAACFGVTPSELGFTEDSNRAVDQNQGRVFFRKALKPILRSIEQKINAALMPEFGIEALEFCFDDYDLEEDKAKHDLLDQEIRMGVKTAEMAATELGIDVTELKAGKEEERQQMREDMEAQASLNKPAVVEQKSTVREEVPDEELMKALEQFLEEETTKVMALVDELPKEQLPKINDNGLVIKALLPEIIKKMNSLFMSIGLSSVVEKVVGKSYREGIDKIERKYNRNLLGDNKTLNAIEQMTFDNIKALSDEHKEKLRGIIQRGVLDGKGSRQIGTEIKDALEVSLVRAKAIARTETNRAYNQGSYDAAKETGLQLEKVWDGTLDMRTSDICKGLHGQRVGFDEDFEYKGEKYKQAPAHVNCRSRVLYVQKGEDL